VKELTILAALIAIYGLAAQRLGHLNITAPMFFVGAGIILGPIGFDVLPLSMTAESVRVLTELTLAVILFADASTLPLRKVERDAATMARLLLIGLPLTMILGAAVAALLFPGIGWGALLIACILAPTDAALGLAVVTNQAVPVRIRQALNVESGLNDGISTPFVALALALTLSEDVSSSHFVPEALTEIVLAVVVAAFVGLVGAWLLQRARGHDWTSLDTEQLVVAALALLAYTLADTVGGNGFIAAFLAGILFGAATKGAFHEQVAFTESVGLLASLAVWAIFGTGMVGGLLGTFTIRPFLYAIVSLTVIRMVPVALAMIGTRFRSITVAFMGWFGPRGLASVVFALLALDRIGEVGGAGSAEMVSVVGQTATWTILLSVLAHGLTANPLAEAFGRRIASGPPDQPELASLQPGRIRRRAI
jgi:NhaP-type Na+/H+ or K+/H+ antiporter